MKPKLTPEEKDAEKAAKAANKEIQALPLAERRAAQMKLMLGAVNKKFGSNSIGLASSLGYKAVPRISSGIFMLDYALGGGWARGRTNMIWGDRSSSKTTTSLRTVSMAQQMDTRTSRFIWEIEEDRAAISAGDVVVLQRVLGTDAFEAKQGADGAPVVPQKVKDRALALVPVPIPMVVSYVDLENALDFNWARRIGVNTDAMLYSRPDSAEEAAEIVESNLRSTGIDLVVLDSLAAMTPQAEAEGAMDAQHVGLAARINSKMFRKVQATINKVMKEESELMPTFLVINQLRHKIGVMFGSPETKPGGLAQDFYTSIEVRVSGSKVNYFDPETKMLPANAEFKFVIQKNKVSPPKIHGSYKMMLVDDSKEGGLLGGEIVEVKEVMEFAEHMKIYEKLDKGFRMYDKVYDTKKELYAEHIMNRQRFAVLKRDVVSRLVPKQ